MLIGLCVIESLRLRLARSVIATIVLWLLVLRIIGINVAACPLRAGRQAKVDEVGVVVVWTGEEGLNLNSRRLPAEAVRHRDGRSACTHGGDIDG